MSELKLNLGCGGDVREGWDNIDLFKRETGCKWDVRMLHLYYKVASVDHILAQDLLEHLGHGDDKRALKLWIAMLKPGGTIEIRCPDLARQCQAFMRGEWSRDVFVRMMFGAQEHEGNYHKSGWTKATLVKELESLGCEIVEARNQWGTQINAPESDNPNIVVIARKKV